MASNKLNELFGSVLLSLQDEIEMKGSGMTTKSLLNFNNHLCYLQNTLDLSSLGHSTGQQQQSLNDQIQQIESKILQTTKLNNSLL